MSDQLFSNTVGNRKEYMPTHYRGSSDEVRALNAYIKLVRAAESLIGRMSQKLADDGLTISQFGALEALHHLGPMSQRRLGEKLLKSSGNITMVVDNLQKRGLVERRRDSQDRRVVTVLLTDAGQKLIAEIFPQHLGAIMAEIGVLDAGEQDELSRLCRRIGLSESTSPDGPADSKPKNL
jgi:MarR family transcriptional regulator, 2-MHQ and catechol-resistance regulon repressor